MGSSQPLLAFYLLCKPNVPRDVSYDAVPLEGFHEPGDETGATSDQNKEEQNVRGKDTHGHHEKSQP